MPNKSLNQLINNTLEEKSITLSQNKKEQVKSIVLKRSKENNKVSQEEVEEIINCVSSKEKVSDLNLLKEFSTINNHFDIERQD